MEPEFNSHDMLPTEGRAYSDQQLPPVRRFEFVAPGFFGVVGTPLIAGRDLTLSDIDNRRPIAIISENLAREMWDEPSLALRKRIREGPERPWREIIGVVGNVYDDGVHQAQPAIVYWPILIENFRRNPLLVQRSVTFAIRTSRAGTESFRDEIQRAVWAIAPDVPVAQVRTLGDVYNQSMARTSFVLVMLAIAGAMALLLGLVGIHAVLSYAVTQRTREIGIRAALGAQHRELKRIFMGKALILTIGVTIGLAASVALTRVIASLLFGVEPVDPITFVGVPFVLAAAAMVASYLPARRAARLDPLVALRYE